MTVDSGIKFTKDPLYKETLHAMQSGEWETSLGKLDQLLEKFPLSPELNNLRADLVLRTHIEQDEQDDIKREKIRNIRVLALRSVIFVVVMGLIYWGTSTYATWIREQWSVIQQSFTSEVQVVELAIKYRDAQSLIQGNRPAEAEALLSDIANIDPDYPGVEDSLVQVEQLLSLETQYDMALNLISQNDFVEALAVLEEIEERSPGYLDVSLKIEEIQGQFYLDTLLEQAETAYEAQDWETAISQFETLRAIAPGFNTELVEIRLLNSYMDFASDTLSSQPESLENLALANEYFRKALVLRPRDENLLREQAQARNVFKDRLFRHYLDTAKSALLEDADSLEVLETANSYFQKALSLKPNNPEAILQRDLATAYIQAQNDFSAGLLDKAIENLEKIYEVEPGYADGTVVQTLYAALMTRGNITSSIGDYEEALIDYQRAAEVSLQSNYPTISLYFAKIKIGEAYGTLFEYAQAVSSFKDAVELVDLLSIAELEDSELAYLLEEADRYAGLEWYRTSYRLYQRVLPASEILFDFQEIVIQEGDYISSLARRYNSTVQSILDANSISDINDLQTGQTIKIPTVLDLSKDE